MVKTARIVRLATIAAAGLVATAVPVSAQQEAPASAPSGDDILQEQDCFPFIAMASGGNQGCSAALGGGLIGAYKMTQAESEDGERNVMMCTMFGPVGTPSPDQSCHFALLGGIIRG